MELNSFLRSAGHFATHEVAASFAVLGVAGLVWVIASEFQNPVQVCVEKAVNGSKILREGSRKDLVGGVEMEALVMAAGEGSNNQIILRHPIGLEKRGGRIVFSTNTHGLKVAAVCSSTNFSESVDIHVQQLLKTARIIKLNPQKIIRSGEGSTYSVEIDSSLLRQLDMLHK